VRHLLRGTLSGTACAIALLATSCTSAFEARHESLSDALRRIGVKPSEVDEIARALLDFYLLGRLPPDKTALRLPQAIDEAEMRDVPAMVGPEEIGAVEGASRPPAAGGALR
jgi:hypothetical protein